MNAKNSEEKESDGVLKLAQNLSRMAELLEKRCDNIERVMKTLLPEQPASEDDESEQNYFQMSQDLAKQLSHLEIIRPLLDDDSINDILINGSNNVFVERNGLLEKANIIFPSDTEVLQLAEKIVKVVGRKIDKKRPLVDARLADGSRVNIIAPPLAVDGTTISIRKFSKKKITLDTMSEQNNISHSLAEFLKIVGKCRLNTVISGGTGSGKTTLLNALSRHIDDRERIVTIEDAAELQLQQPHVVRLETRPYIVGMKEGEEVSMRDLVKNALRMRPDRILVGEVRGPEAFDMMQAMNTGHEGSLTTVHANHPRDALSRLENMISMADLQIPVKSLRYQIASALHLIIQISRMRDGFRRITYVTEVVGMEGDMITMHDLFNFVPTGEDTNGKITGEYKWTGIMPRFIRRVAYYGEVKQLEAALGIKLPKNI
jgi:pilus assembly protein CpaF